MKNNNKATDTDTPQETTKVFYNNYLTWKNWHKSSTENANQRRDHVYNEEMTRGKVRNNGKILEIGFGNGYFLDWAARQGYKVFGIEIIDELTNKAKSNGHNVFTGTLIDIEQILSTDFDAIVAFDVFEHLDAETLIKTLQSAYRILNPGGCVIARFPNGLSPFGRYYQYGDFTHQTVLHSRSIEQLGKITNFKLDCAYNAARLPDHTLNGKFRIFIRGLIERLIGYTYFNNNVLPLDPNMTVVLKKELN